MLAASGSQSFMNLKAISQIGGSGEKGMIHKGRGIDGVDAVDGFSGGMSEDEGSYQLLNANVILKKNVKIDKDRLITVYLTVTVGGEGSVKDVNIVDVIPAQTIYVRKSLKLDGKYISTQGRYLENRAEVLVSLVVIPVLR